MTGWWALEMWSVKMTVIGLETMMEVLDREDAWGRHVKMLLRRMWKVVLCPERMHRSGTTTHHNHFMALFPGPPRWAGIRRELLDSTCSRLRSGTSREVYSRVSQLTRSPRKCPLKCVYVCMAMLAMLTDIILQFVKSMKSSSLIRCFFQYLTITIAFFALFCIQCSLSSLILMYSDFTIIVDIYHWILWTEVFVWYHILLYYVVLHTVQVQVI